MSAPRPQSIVAPVRGGPIAFIGGCKLSSLQGMFELVSDPGCVHIFPEFPTMGSSTEIALLSPIDPPGSERGRFRSCSSPQVDADPLFGIRRSLLGREPYSPYLAQVPSLLRGEMDDDHITRLYIVCGVYDLSGRRNLEGFLENLEFFNNALVVLRWRGLWTGRSNRRTLATCYLLPEIRKFLPECLLLSHLKFGWPNRSITRFQGRTSVTLKGPSQGTNSLLMVPLGGSST